MEKKMMIGVAALALLAVAALSIVGTYAYPGVNAVATASGSGDCDQDMLQTRLQIQDRDCNSTGACNMTCENPQVRTRAQTCENQGVDCNGTQSQPMHQSRECLSLGEQAQQNCLQTRNQMMAQTSNNRP